MPEAIQKMKQVRKLQVIFALNSKSRFDNLNTWDLQALYQVE